MNDAESSLRRKKQLWKELDEKEPLHPSLAKTGLLLKVHLKTVMTERLVLEKKEPDLQEKLLWEQGGQYAFF